MSRRDEYEVTFTWAQVVALTNAARASLYGYAPASNANALRHALAKLKRQQYRPTRAQRDLGIGAGPRLVK